MFLGFPLGGLLSLAIMACAAIVFHPLGIGVEHLSQVGAAVGAGPRQGRPGLVLIGFFAATFGAALETACRAATRSSQYFGWQWGKFVRPARRRGSTSSCSSRSSRRGHRAHRRVDPIKVTEYSIVFSAVALPLTYFPILVVANDPDYMGDKMNGRFSNVLGSIYLVILVAARRRDPADDRHQGGCMMAAGRVLDAGLHLLDRQLVDRDGRLCGKVDDLELEVPDDGGLPVVTALISTAPASSRRAIGGPARSRVLGELHRRLHPTSRRAGPRPLDALSLDIGSAVRLNLSRRGAGDGGASKVGAESTLSTRIPGDRHAPTA